MARSRSPRRGGGGGDVQVAGSAGLGSALDSGRIRAALDLMDQLRSLGVQRDVGIPQIVAVGDQSSGKSSLLEAISGVAFPRGTGTVTRCATEVRMKRTPGTSRMRLFTTDDPGNVTNIESRDKIAGLIEEKTEYLIGKRAGQRFSAEHSIVIELESADVPDLTLIDLPGIIRYTAGENGESDIDAINTAIESYMSQERTIILAVVPSNQDIATVEILQRVRRVDPRGERTVGVLTKPDLIDRGAESGLLDIVANKSDQLKLGWVVVKSRSQQDINDALSVEEARRREMDFFAGHEIFGSLVGSADGSGVLGVGCLSEKLTRTLVARITAMLPQMKQEVRTKLDLARQQLQAMGEPVGSSAPEMRMCLMGVWRDIKLAMGDAVDGTYAHSVFRQRLDSKAPTAKLFLFTRALDLFKAFEKEVRDSKPKFRSEEYIKELMARTQQRRGRELPGFLSRPIFESFVAEFVAKWTSSADALAAQVKEAVRDASEALAGDLSARVPRLGPMLAVLAGEVLDELDAESRARVRALFEAEEVPFTMNHYLMDTVNKIMGEKLGSEKPGAAQAVTLKQGVENIIADKIAFMRQTKQTATGLFGGAVSDAALSVTIQAVSDSLKGVADDVVRLLPAPGGNGHLVGRGNEEQDAEYMSAMLEAYWKVSAKRLIDECAMQVDKCILRNFACRLDDRLAEKFMDNQVLASLAGESAEAQERRKSLAETVARLAAGIQAMDGASIC